MKKASIGVIDVGKTNIKLYLLSNDIEAAVLTSWQIENQVINTPPYPHFDTERHWAWLMDRLKEASSNYCIDKLITTAHGACAALVTGDQLVLPILDYEHNRPESCVDYTPPDFTDTLSPALPLGLNVGRQLYWQQQQFPTQFSQVTTILPYPQYWAWRLSGIAANEVSSIGAHTDLWLPRSGEFSDFAHQQGWSRLFAPLRRAWEALGPIKTELASQTGLPTDCQILVGLHDSNSSLLPHLIGQTSPFTVISTGTWVILMSVGAELDHLDPAKDTLGNVNVLGDPVACARFMGGREYALLSGGAQATEEEILQAAEALIRARVYALPNWTQTGGPWPGQTGKIIGDAPTTPAQKIALASLYCALMVDSSLAAVGASEGSLIVEGSFIKSPLFCEVLKLLRPQQSLRISADFAGTTRGAAILANWDRREQIATPQLNSVNISLTSDIHAYANEWKGRVEIL